MSFESSITEFKDAHCRRYRSMAEESERTQNPGALQHTFEASAPFAGFVRKHVTLQQREHVGSQAAGLVVAGGMLWVNAGRDGMLRRIDPRSGRFIGNPIAITPGAYNIAATADAIWVPTVGGVNRVRLTPQRPH